MSCIDSNFKLSFISEDGSEGIFYPASTSEFIDYLTELDSNLTQFLFSENFEPTEEITNYLQEAVSAYIEAVFEDKEVPCGCEQYYPELYQFLENSSIDEIYLQVEEGEEEEHEINEAIYSFFESEGWEASIPNSTLVQTLVQETTFKKIVRGGRVIKRADCPPGFKWNGERCVRMASSELRKRMKAAFKANKTRSKHMRNAMFAKSIMKKRAKSMKVRGMKGIR
jgi:hypothetical protein